jgi:hypothetical protein
MTPPSTWQPYREPLRVTLMRTIAIAVVVGAVLTFVYRARWSRWPLLTLLILWPSLGGHFVELWFLNWLRPRLPATRAVQIVARLATWFVAGIALQFAMCMTARALTTSPRCPAWYLGGPALIAIELTAHGVLYLRGRPSFFSGRM